MGEPPTVSLGGAEPELVELVNTLLDAARAAPLSGEMRGRLAMAYEVNGFSDTAVSVYEQAGRLDPQAFAWPYFRALLLARRGDLDAALQDMDRALAVDPDYVPAWLWRGAWLLDQGRDDEALIVYQRAEFLGAGSPAAVGLARIALRQGKPASAAALLEPVNVDLRHPHIYRLLGRAYRDMGRSDDARIAFARGRLAAPLQWRDPRQAKKADYIGRFGGLMVHAQNLLEADRNEEALALLEPWRQRRGDDPALLSNLGWAYSNARQWDRAFEVLRHGLDIHPDNYYLHFGIARLYRQSGDPKRALTHLEKAVSFGPAQAPAFEELGSLLAAEGRSDDALAAFAAAIRHGARNPEKLLQASGLVEGARGRWSAAIEFFQQAVEIDPSLTMAYVHLGRSLAEAGQLVPAREALAWAGRLDTHPWEVAAAELRLVELEAEAREGGA